MSLPTPNTPKEVQDDARTDVQREMPSLNPFLPNSFAGALIVGYSNRLFDNYQNVNDAVDAAFYDTSPEEFLVRQASWYRIYRKDESRSSGLVVFGGTDGSQVSIDQELLTSNGVTIKMDEEVDILSQQYEPVSITPNGATAIVTTSEEHNLSSQILVTVSGVTNDENYNGTFEINVIGSNTFTYEMSEIVTVIANGTNVITSWTSGFGSATSSDFGAETNIGALTELTLSPEVSGVDSIASVDYTGFSGGSDQETTEELRGRLLDRVANPISNFNVSAIEQKCFEISGVTRVWVQETTPNLGQVTVYFMRDNDEDPVPVSQEIVDVKNSVLQIKPANTSDSDVIFPTIVPVSVDFDFSQVSPNTVTMHESILEKLKEFFATEAELEENIIADQYKTAIYNTVDTVTGDPLESFSLSLPTGNVIVNASQIGVLGTVTFPQVS